VYPIRKRLGGAEELRSLSRGDGGDIAGDGFHAARVELRGDGVGARRAGVRAAHQAGVDGSNPDTLCNA